LLNCCVESRIAILPTFVNIARLAFVIFRKSGPPLRILKHCRLLYRVHNLFGRGKTLHDFLTAWLIGNHLNDNGLDNSIQQFQLPSFQTWVRMNRISGSNRSYSANSL
jgi:hypothetical protein